MTLRLRPVVFVVAAANIGALLAGGWAVSQPDNYRATAEAVISPSPSLAEDSDVISVINGLDRTGIAATAAGLVGSRSVRLDAAAMMQVNPRDLADFSIEGIPVLGSSLVDITVSGPSNSTAAELANSVTGVLQQRIGELYPVYRLEVVTEPTPPTNSTRPPVVVLALAAATAASIGAILVLYATSVGRRLRGLHDRVT